MVLPYGFLKRSLQRPGRSPVLAPEGMASTSHPRQHKPHWIFYKMVAMRWMRLLLSVLFRRLSSLSQPALEMIVFSFILKVEVNITEYSTGDYFYLTDSLFYIENDMNIIHCMTLWICRYLVRICLIKAVNNFIDFGTFAFSESCFEHSFRP